MKYGRLMEIPKELKEEVKRVYTEKKVYRIEGRIKEKEWSLYRAEEMSIQN
jgi:hypothetical protein